MNNRHSLQIHRCFLAIAVTVLMADIYAYPSVFPDRSRQHTQSSLSTNSSMSLGNRCHSSDGQYLLSPES